MSYAATTVRHDFDGIDEDVIDTEEDTPFRAQSFCSCGWSSVGHYAETPEDAVERARDYFESHLDSASRVRKTLVT